jgi:tRNA/tmRNA/rRNA uracil-C5-methylase (TrmA/RlmC/RlmD family)
MSWPGGTASPPIGTVPDGARSWLDRVLELDVGPIAHGGHCVARFDGRVVFVRHALPGERVRAVVTEDRHASYCRADAIAVLSASPDRVDPGCAWARAGGCGGCDFQHVAPEAQRRLKGQVLAEQLRRLAGVDRVVEVEPLPGGPLGWRHRVRLAVGADGVPGLRAHRSHDVIPVAGCPLTPDGMLDEALSRRWPPGRDLEVVSDEVQRVGGRRWRVPPGSFWQAHPALPAALCAALREWTEPVPGGQAWDLYGGAGLLAVVLAELVGPDGSVTVVESDAAAVRAGQDALADLPWVRWRVGRVERSLARLPRRPDVVVADPPRAGLGRAVASALASVGPSRLVLVACDPATLARDTALLAQGGYRLAALRAFDAFPMTHHLEAVALFIPAG